jgi:hypothetical protein
MITEIVSVVTSLFSTGVAYAQALSLPVSTSTVVTTFFDPGFDFVYDILIWALLYVLPFMALLAIIYFFWRIMKRFLRLG